MISATEVFELHTDADIDKLGEILREAKSLAPASLGIVVAVTLSRTVEFKRAPVGVARKVDGRIALFRAFRVAAKKFIRKD